MRFWGLHGGGYYGVLADFPLAEFRACFDKGFLNALKTIFSMYIDRNIMVNTLLCFILVVFGPLLAHTSYWDFLVVSKSAIVSLNPMILAHRKRLLAKNRLFR